MVSGIIPHIRDRKHGDLEAFSIKILRKYLDEVSNQNTDVYKDADMYEQVYRFHTGKYEYLPLA
jgi:hypothetical protein